MLRKQIDSIAEEITPKLIELRHTIHAHPELAFEEHRTASLVADTLGSLGLAPRTGIGGTGVVAVIHDGSSGPTVGVRADLDALPVTETTGLPFASTVPGKMHACGHDVHSAILIGVAEVLSRLRHTLPGKVKLIFQPAEETLAGALAMIRDGVLDDPAMDAIIGYHNWPPLAAGKIGYRDGSVMASSDGFDITIKGRAGHAAHPHTAVDAIVGAGHLLTQLQTVISREIAPMVPAVVTVGQINGGKARNVIADTVTLSGAVRALDAAAADHVEAAIRRIVAGTCASLRLDSEITWTRMAPVLANDPEVLATAVGAVRAILGPENVEVLPSASMGSEDFAWYAEKIPAAHLRIGSKIDGLDTALHNGNYDCNDLAITTGVRAVSNAVVALLGAETLGAG